MYLRELLTKRCVWGACSQCRLYRKSNPGVDRRLKILKQENPDLSKMRIKESDVEDLEMDIMNTSLLREDYERERDKISKRIEFQRVERKYFDKHKSPNFLLWSEKEQIRQLHESQPDKWTFDRLSQSFPAVPDVIKKIVKAQWKMKDLNSLKKHDSRVLGNWKLFRAGKLDLPPQLADHLSKFTARDSPLQTKECTGIVLAEDKPKVKESSTKRSEFADIIRNYARKDDQSVDGTREIDESVLMPSTPGETYVLNSREKRATTKGFFTLSEMRKTGRILPTQSTLLHHKEDATSSGQGTTKADLKTGVINPSDFNGVPHVAYADSTIIEQTDDPPDEIPMKITIPKDKWKKGAVYKVNNCFYADDGEFLYKI